MKNIFIVAILNIACLLLSSNKIHAQDVPDTVKVGIYITSIHDIDFKQKEYAITFWLWLKYKNKDFDFMQNLEVPQAEARQPRFRSCGRLPNPTSEIELATLD